MQRGTVKCQHGLIFGLIILLPFLGACASIRGLVGELQMQRPSAKFAGAKIDKLSLDSADLLFDIAIENPNQVGLALAGLEYDLLIDGTSFLKGQQRDQLKIGAKGQSHIQLPLTLAYTDLYKTFQNLLDSDVSQYQLSCTLAFDVPVLGAVKLPLQKAGELPLIKLPKLSVDALKVGKVGLTGAQMSLNVRLKNPNAFSMLLNRFHYGLVVNEKDWAAGDMGEGIQITEKGEGLLEIPINLNFLEIGQSAYALVKGDKDFDYKLAGGLDFTASIPLLGKVSLPFDLAGKIRALE